MLSNMLAILGWAAVLASVSPRKPLLLHPETSWCANRSISDNRRTALLVGGVALSRPWDRRVELAGLE
jgi:hypothetical protein